jgi:NAD(P)-dependent dehydrogenase (short-subunit alcohol dehydrogenase family)
MEDPDALQQLVDAVVADFGFVDILVNNAGIASRGHSVTRTDPAELERVIRVHALAPHRLCQLVLPSMKTRPRGDIVMISSAATLHHAAGGAPYNMGKAAMEALALTLSKEVKKRGIRVNIVAPGLVETEMGRRLMKATAGVNDLRQLDATMPFGRVCQPDDIANAVRWLVSDRASYVTGEKINVYGGGQ